MPVKAGDRVKTDRRDALKLARSCRAGDLTPVWVPDAAHETLRDLVRAREAAKKDQLRARQRLGKFLLRHGRRRSTGMNPWTQRHLLWVKGVRFAHAAQEATFLDYLHEVEHMAARLEQLEAALDEAVQTAPAPMRIVIEALQALRGIAQVSAATIVAELGQVSRFARPPQLMSYSGTVASEYSSGTRRPAGGCGPAPASGIQPSGMHPQPGPGGCSCSAASAAPSLRVPRSRAGSYRWPVREPRRTGGKALWKLVENAQRFPRCGGRVLCVHGDGSFHRAHPYATRSPRPRTAVDP